MNNLFSLIYFIHDDIDEEFKRNVRPTLLDINIYENIKVILVHNKRNLFGEREEDQYVTYRCDILEIVKDDQGKTIFKTLRSDMISWDEALLFVFGYLKQHNFFERIGLITLSHSNGFVINRNNERLPIRIINLIGNFLKSLFHRKVKSDFRYIKKVTKDGDLFVTSKTVVEKVSGSIPNRYKAKYSRDNGKSFCKTYEGLFITEFSNFLNENLRVENRSDVQKLAFYMSSNCNFQLYDNLFLFSNVAEFTMGAQSRNNYSFWDISVIVESINSNIEKANMLICEDIFAKCAQKFESERSERTKYYSLSKLKEFPSLHFLFDKIIGMLIDNLNSHQDFRRGLINGISKLPVTSDDQFIPYFDIIEFFSMANQIANIGFAAELDNFKKQKDEQIIMNQFVKADGHSGFSIYLPRNTKEFNELKGALCNYFDATRPNNFSLHSRYDEFLTVLYQ